MTETFGFLTFTAVFGALVGALLWLLKRVQAAGYSAEGRYGTDVSGAGSHYSGGG
jgi:hypothetical protein